LASAAVTHTNFTAAPRTRLVNHIDDGANRDHGAICNDNRRQLATPYDVP
jgi:hypothetical protein